MIPARLVIGYLGTGNACLFYIKFVNIRLIPVVRGNLAVASDLALKSCVLKGDSLQQDPFASATAPATPEEKSALFTFYR